MRSRIEALGRRARRDVPALAVVDLYEDDDEAAAAHWPSEFEASAPHGVAVSAKLALLRPSGKP